MSDYLKLAEGCYKAARCCMDNWYYRQAAYLLYTAADLYTLSTGKVSPDNTTAIALKLCSLFPVRAEQYMSTFSPCEAWKDALKNSSILPDPDEVDKVWVSLGGVLMTAGDDTLAYTMAQLKDIGIEKDEAIVGAVLDSLNLYAADKMTIMKNMPTIIERCS